MFAGYTAFCFPDNVLGTWQGGSGLALKGQDPTPPGKQVECSASSFIAHQKQCDAVEPCTDCEYWPIYPCYSESKPMVDCLYSYEGDFLYKTAGYMRDALTREGHDSRYITIAGGGHSNPKNAQDWQAGCLGITTACTATCASSFTSCVNTKVGAGTASDVAFKQCNEATSMPTLSGCTATCSPTLAMLRRSWREEGRSDGRGVVVLSCLVLLCFALLCCALLCCAVLCCAVLCCAVRCCALHCPALHYPALPCSALHCSALLCSALLCTALLNTLLYSALLCSAPLHSDPLYTTLPCPLTHLEPELSETTATVTLSQNKFGAGSSSAGARPGASKCVAASNPAGSINNPDNSPSQGENTGGGKGGGAGGAGSTTTMIAVASGVAVVGLAAVILFFFFCRAKGKGHENL